jgi:hypothetical protein
MSGCSLSIIAQNLLWQNRVVEKEIGCVPLPVVFLLLAWKSGLTRSSLFYLFNCYATLMSLKFLYIFIRALQMVIKMEVPLPKVAKKIAPILMNYFPVVSRITALYELLPRELVA